MSTNSLNRRPKYFRLVLGGQRRAAVLVLSTGSAFFEKSAAGGAGSYVMLGRLLRDRFAHVIASDLVLLQRLAFRLHSTILSVLFFLYS